MRLPSLASFSLIAMAGLTAFSAPPASPGPGAADFKKALDAADRAFTAGSYLQSVAQLRDAIDLANATLRDALIEAMPGAPAGFRPLAVAAPANPQVRDPLMSALASSAGRPIEKRFEALDGQGHIRIVVAPNAPQAATVAQLLRQTDNDGRFTAVVVGKYTGVLVKDVLGTALRFAVADRHLFEIQAAGLDDEKLRAMVDERTLQKMAALLAD